MSQQHRAGSPAGAPLPQVRLRWWRELALVLPAYWLYTLVRNAVPHQESSAIRNADQLYRLEQALGIDIELGVNLAIDRISWLIVGMNYFYAVAHFVVTAGVMVWLYHRHPRHYRPARNVFLVTNVLALVVFYTYPLAPPRLMPDSGYVDTVVAHGTWGSWASGDVAAASNQYAAMPSMHVAWSLWCAIVLVLVARRRWMRVLGVAHASATLVVIVATANHFVLDAAGGALALGGGYAVVWFGTAAQHRYRRQRIRQAGATPTLPPAEPEPAPVPASGFAAGS